MRNIRLYIGGMRCDLDSAINIPFTFQTTDAEMPSSVRNSYSKSVSLPGTENNRRIFGGLWHLDSIVTKSIPGTPGSPAVYAPWNQLVNHGNFDSTSGWTRYNSSTMSFSVSNNVGIVDVTGTQRQPLMYRTISAANTHKIYWTHTLRITAATARQFRTGRLYTPNQYFQSSAYSTNDFTNWKRLSGIMTLDSDKTRIYVGFYGQTSSATLAAGDKVEIKNVMLCDLTEIYGAGNEPTKAEFEQTYHLDEVEYYPYAAIGSQIEIQPATPGSPDITGDIGIFYDPMKRVDFQLYVDEMVVERGYCQLVNIQRKGRDYTFTVGLFGGLGEYFYNLDTDGDGEKRTLASLDFGSDLTHQINKTYVQSNWDAILGGTLPTIAYVPMHNGTPKTIDADKLLIKGGGLPSSITDGGNTYTTEGGYLLGKAERKYTEWEIGDLRSYLQRPALRLKDFIAAVCDPNNNGGWTVNLDSDFFDASNPYYEKTYILLPQLNVSEETEDICDDGTYGANSFHLTNASTNGDLTPTASCMTLSGDYVDMSGVASNAYLKLSLPVQVRLASSTNYGNLYSNTRFSGRTVAYCTTIQAVAYDDQGNVVGTSPRYVFACKNHHGEVQNLIKPTPAVSTSDALIEGVYKYDSGKYLFVQDETNANTFALQIDKIARPSSTLHQVKVTVYVQRNFYYFNTKPRGNDATIVAGTNAAALWHDILSGSSNTLALVQPTQYASDSIVKQSDLLSSLDATPLEVLLSITKRFGLMWVQENQAKTVSVFMRKNYYTGEIEDIHERIDYSKGLKVTPVAAKSNNYVLADEDVETTLSLAYDASYGREYGDVRLKVGYDFGEDKVEMMEKCKLKEVVDGALSGNGYWTYSNAGGELPSPIAGGMKVTYYYDNGGTIETKDIDYNLFSVTAVSKKNAPALGCACKTDDGEEAPAEVAPALVFVQGGQVDGSWYLTDDITAMATLNDSPCWIWDRSLTAARVPKFGRVATFSGETFSLDYGTPKETYYIPEVSLAPEQAVYHRYWEDYLLDLLSRDTKVVECYVVFPHHLDMRQQMRKFYLFDRTLWVLNKVTDYDPTKDQTVKCEFIRVINQENYTG